MSRLILLLKNQKIEIYKFYLNFFYFFSISIFQPFLKKKNIYLFIQLFYKDLFSKYLKIMSEWLGPLIGSLFWLFIISFCIYRCIKGRR